jgi:quercetin dioxygenase-like cupin family protein
METMEFTYPHTIENGLGEKLTFLEVFHEPEGDRIMVESYAAPGSGPSMHVHWLQDEVLTVAHGRIGYQLLGQPEQFAEKGETVVFKRGVPHRFWNPGTEMLHCTGWINPAGSILFFLSAIFAAQKKSGKTQPERFDAAYLLTRYRDEFEMLEIPRFVRRVVLPLIYQFGRILGKYPHFEGAPDPVHTSSK